jgi:phage terminase Nu1 subunit (DNA packaging protein)
MAKEIKSFASFINEDVMNEIETEVATLPTEDKKKFHDVTKKELDAVWSETDLPTKKAKAAIIINSLASDTSKPKLLADIQRATSPISIDRIVTNVMLIGRGLKTIK